MFLDIFSSIVPVYETLSKRKHESVTNSTASFIFTNQ